MSLKSVLFADEKLFSIARNAKLDKVVLQPLFARLQERILQEFGVRAIHIALDYVELGQALSRPRLSVILETGFDYESWKTDGATIRPEIEERVLAQFTELAVAEGRESDTKEVFLVIDNFSEVCIGKACDAFLAADANDIVREFDSVPIWTIDGFSRHLVVFLMTNKDIQHRTSDGTCSEILNKCFDAVRKHDKFGYVTQQTFRLAFDSKENLDKNYEGNLFYYWR